jgi:peptidyl-prolyl cis-trans isomerase SurA
MIGAQRETSGNDRIGTQAASSTDRFRRLGLVAGLVLACLPALPQTVRAQSEETIVVLVNDEPISAYDVDQRERFLTITTHKAPSPALRKQAIDMLIDERLQLQEGKEMKIFPDESEVNQVLDSMATKNNLTAAKLTEALAHLGVNINTLKDRIRAELVWQDVIRQKFAPTVAIGQADIDKALAAADTANLAQQTTVDVKKVRFILPSHASQAAIAERISQADLFQTRFRSCDSVAIMAKDFSGTSISELTTKASNIPQPARTMVMNGDAGQMTAPSISGSSVDLYAICSKETAKDAPERTMAERQLMNKDLAVKAEQLLRDLRQDAYIEHRD